MKFARDPKSWRDTVVFLGGLSGLIYETTQSGTDRPTLLVIFAAMIGLPGILRVDESQTKGEQPTAPTPPTPPPKVDAT